MPDTANALLCTENLCVGYGERPILQDVSLRIPHGKITALLGPNGCGKSTLLKTLVRLLTPQSGRVSWKGETLHRLPSRQVARQLALLPQTQPIPEGIRVRELVAYGRSPYTGFWGKLSAEDRDAVASAMSATGIEPLADRLVSELSGGQRQRAWLATTLAQDTDYLLLDEPTTYMDLNHQVELMLLLRQLNQRGKTVISVLHDINQASRYCDHLVVMHQGQIVAEGTPDAILTPELLRQVFSVDAEIHTDPLAGTPMCVVR